MICSQNEIKLYKNFQLANFNTLKIKSIAKYFYMPDNYGEMISIFKQYKNDTPVILGNGSNVLFSSNGVNQPIIHTRLLDRHHIIGTTLEVEAGMKTQTLAKFALDKEIEGFEFLIGIPASLGGALYMNAGAHGQTISDNLISVKVYNWEENEIITLKKEEMNFSYRHSILQEKPYILLTAKFLIKKGIKETIKAKMDENLIFRKNHQPNLSLPNAGSVFKNPPNSDLSAGALIDRCGLRGYGVGDCEVWENHCNFIINKGEATSIDYTNIVFDIYTQVKEKFNIELTPEIIYIGKMTEKEKEKWKILKR